MRRGVLASATAVLLVGPAVTAFFSGGYFDAARLRAAVVAWVLVVVVALLAPRPLPSSPAGRTALGGLVLMTVWSAVSFVWAPVAGPAVDNVTRLLLYVGVLIASIALLRERRASRAVEPVLAFGTVAVIGYGLAGRLLPGIVEHTRSAGAGARLEHPLSYWNAEGALAAIGLVLCIHLAGDASRRRLLRGLAAAAWPVLAAGLLLSYSRGALVAAVVGIVVLLALEPSWTLLRSAGVALAAGGAASAAAAAFPGVAHLSGSASARERDGTLVLCVLLAIGLLASLATTWTARGEREATDRARRIPAMRALRVVATATVALALAGGVVGGLAERRTGALASDRQDAQRLTSLQSNRYEYWRVGVRAFADHPLLGLGSGGFRVAWTRERRISESVRDVHSLVVEMATELGVLGLVSLALLIGGVAAAGRRALCQRHPAVAGWCAASMVWLVHATIDWDWQMPGVTLPVVVLAGALIAVGESTPRAPSRHPSAAPRSEASVAPGERELSARH